MQRASELLSIQQMSSSTFVVSWQLVLTSEEDSQPTVKKVVEFACLPEIRSRRMDRTTERTILGKCVMASIEES